MIRLRWRRGIGPSEGGKAADSPTGSSEAPSRLNVRGERGVTVADRRQSLQSRLNTVLAVMMTAGVGATMTVWYYSQTLRHVRGRTRVARSSVSEPIGASLPALGPLLPRHIVRPLPAASASAQAAATVGIARASRMTPNDSESTPPGWSGMDSGLRSGLRSTEDPISAGSRRRLSGPVFWGTDPDVAARVPVGAVRGAGKAAAVTGYPDYPPASPVAGRLRSGSLATLLRPTVLRAVRADLLPQQRLLLPKGAFIDCTLETAIDSTLPGMTTCVTATDTFSADGSVVLLERGTKLIGETRGQVSQGSARVFVIWVEARTPHGVVVRLDSPGTDALGRSGLTGKINWHFWRRFGAALLVSTIDGVAQSRLQSSTGAVVIEPTATEDVMTGALRNAQDIPPTIKIPNGARIQVLVARDVDFSSVYELEPR